MSAQHDSELGRETAHLLGRSAAPYVVALVHDGRVRTAVRGCDPSTDVEIGSVSKGVTGLLLHDAIDRGEVTLDTRLGDHLDLGSGRIAEVTLGSLAAHRSGLPRLAPGSHALRGTWRLLTRGENPYGDSLADLLARVRDVQPGKPKAVYSNLGFMLLGHALASAAGTSYASLLEARITEPLGLAGMYVPSTPRELRPSALRGRSRLVREVEPWTGAALGPAGGIRAGVADLAGLLAAVLDGSAPGVAALEPTGTFAGPGVRIGAAWLTVTHKGREVTWHNGGTGGFRSFVGFDRAAGRGVALVQARTTSVDRAGFALVTDT